MAVSNRDLPLGARLYLHRQEKRRRKTTSDKYLIGLYKRLKQIDEEQTNLGYEDLDPPVQRGWKRLFILTQVAAEHADAAFMQSLLDKINVTTYSHRKDFKYKKKRQGKKVYEIRPQSLPIFSPWSYQRLNLSEKEQSYFKEVLTYSTTSAWETEFVFTQPYLFELKVLPNMITKIKIIDYALEKEEAEIRRYLESQHFWPRLRKLLDGYYQYRNNWRNLDKEKYRSLVKTNSINKLLTEYYNENVHEQS